MMAILLHPSTNDITLEGVLGALASPMRRNILKTMMRQNDCMSCTEAMPHPDMAKSTLSNHFRILREAGIILTAKQGVQHRNVIRLDDLEARFPGLIKLVLNLSDK